MTFDYVLSGATYHAVILEISVDAGGKIEVKWNTSTTNRMNVYCRGFVLPEGM